MEECGMKEGAGGEGRTCMHVERMGVGTYMQVRERMWEVLSAEG